MRVFRHAVVLVLLPAGVAVALLAPDRLLRPALIVVVVAVTGLGVAGHRWTAQRDRLREEVDGHRQLTDALVQTVDVGLLALGRDGGYESMNPRQREFLSLAFPDGHAGLAGQAGHVYAADNATTVGYDDMPSVRAMNGETFNDVTVWVGGGDAPDRRALSVSARPLLDEDGAFDGAVLAYHDITDLMRALSVKDDFVAAVSHELRTPLTSIIGYLDLASDHDAVLPEEVRHFLSVAERNADRLLLLVSDLLTAAQTQRTAMRLSPEPTDLVGLVRTGLDAVAQRARIEGKRVDARLEPLPKVIADPCRVSQVVDNLLSNALKYTPSGGAIEVTLERGETGVRLTVADTGMGISAHDQAAVFTKFFRARDVTDLAIPGIGLGLVITKAIVDAHGGHIVLQSQQDVGTTVHVTLPFVPTPTDASAVPEDEVA